MTLPIEQQLSEEEYQVIEGNRLGVPLSTYKLRSWPIQFLFGASLCIFLVGCSTAVIAITIGFMGVYTEQSSGYFILAVLVCFSIPGLFFGLLGLRKMVPQSRKQYIVVCEYGFFQVGSKGWKKQIEVVRWKDIQSVRKFLVEYAIIYGENKNFILDRMYQHVKELVEHVKIQSGFLE